MEQGAKQLLQTTPSFLLGVTKNAIPSLKGHDIVVGKKKFLFTCNLIILGLIHFIILGQFVCFICIRSTNIVLKNDLHMFYLLGILHWCSKFMFSDGLCCAMAEAIDSKSKLLSLYLGFFKCEDLG